VIAGVVLAAGGSVRLGRPKALVEIGGRPLVLRAAEAVLGGGCAPVVVVVGAEAAGVRSVLAATGVRIVVHEGWARGIAGSIRAGVAVVEPHPEVEAVLLAVCDQPALDAVVIRRLLDAWRARPAGRSLAACAYAGTLASPAVFPRARFADLAALRGDRGAASLLRRDRSAVVPVPWPDGARDVDRPEDVEGQARADRDPGAAPRRGPGPWDL